MDKKETLTIEPYARLLTMLGDQLIKNERIALVELIKNSYDADANWVKVIFENFGDNYQIQENSRIIIEDDGQGMNENIMRSNWLNPASPGKKIKKKIKDKTPKGRYIQGEKGIGRFAILKLGKNIRVISRAENEDTENVMGYDFLRYDNEFLTKNGSDEEIFLKDLDVTFYTRKPKAITENEIICGDEIIERLPHGTRIEITGLKGTWSKRKIKEILKDLNRFESIFSKPFDTDEDSEDKKNDFEVFLYKDDQIEEQTKEYLKNLYLLMENRSVLKVKGTFDEKNNCFEFEINEKKEIYKLDDPTITALLPYKERFGKKGEQLIERSINCGSFDFGFYVFDFSSEAPGKYRLDNEDKKIVKDHRIYLYRDDVRVYPYGEPEDDWLRIDIDRGTKSAGMFLSNDQVVGYVNITQNGNPKLQDKTNREGLIETEEATADFIALIRTFLAYVRSKPYARYRKDIEKKDVQRVLKKQVIENTIESLKKEAKEKENKDIFRMAKIIESNYRKEKDYLLRRAETTEELAGIGLSVESASHDVMSFMSKSIQSINDLIKDVFSSKELDKDFLIKELQSLQGSLTFIEAQLKDIQLLFKSSKQRKKMVKVKDVIQKIQRIYRRILEVSDIEFIVTEIGSPFSVRTTDALLMQLFLNLFDNAVFWLNETDQIDKKIQITLDGDNLQLIFSDNGPGISEEDADYVFEPFYSGKGEEGRGLGLYIAKQLLERSEFTIDLAYIKEEKRLPGANFVINFVTEEK